MWVKIPHGIFMLTKSLKGIFDQWRGNAFPSMIEDLGTHLGVSANSLKRLGVGWAPVVTFKKGPNYTGWWAVPERDADANLIGIGLRAQDDSKFMYPGSKHGLIYEVNPEHERGGQENAPGQWIRTTEAGVTCPICGKPDGCLVNAETPDDPNGDAICIRVKDGATRPMEFGYLHSKREFSRSAPILANNGGPVLIVEGMSDAVSAMDLGFDVVGRPSNLAGLDFLCDVVRGRDCIVVGENDTKVNKLTGKLLMPGREGMVAAFQMIRRAAHRVTMLMPPEHYKDLRAWVGKAKIDHAAFLEYHEKHLEEHAEELLLPDKRPLTIALAYLNTQHKLNERYTLRRWEGGWYKYEMGKYHPVTDESAEAPMYRWAHDKQVEVTTAKGSSIAPLFMDTALVRNVTEAIAAETSVSEKDIPSWINGRKGPDPRNLICFTNGIVDVPAFLEGKDERYYLLEPTPDLFTTAVMPFAFDPTATCGRWRGFLRASLGDDPKKIQLLREWFGYCMTPDTTMQKMMYFRGPPAAGKSVILNILGAMIGKEHTAVTQFASLASNFGANVLVGKLVCLVPDARTPKGESLNRGLELLLNIASGDPISIDRKFRDALPNHRLMARICIASNEFLDLPDHSGAMTRRLNVIQFARSFQDVLDHGLEARIVQEIPGIAVWALKGLQKLREQGHFTVPESSIDAVQDWRTSNSPLASFLDEATEIDETYEEGQRELFDAFLKWSEERRMVRISNTKFRERMSMNAPYATGDTRLEGSHKITVYRGLRLRDWARRNLLGRP